MGRHRRGLPDSGTFVGRLLHHLLLHRRRVSVVFVRPVALRWLHKNEPNRATNADALIGRTGRVTEAIAKGGNGYVQIDGDQWKAVSTGDDIAAGTTVRVVDRQSTIVTVVKSEE